MFDTVVLNSVVQYFPGIDYLVEVLRGAVEVAAAGGSVFIGDVRSLPLLDAFSASVELAQAEGSMAVAELRERIGRLRRREQELVIDPAFFLALQRELPRIREVRIAPKYGRRHNELTRFRYDVTLRLDGIGPETPLGETSGWQGQTTPAVERTGSRSGEWPQASGVSEFALVCRGTRTDADGRGNWVGGGVPSPGREGV
ncbi:MAG: hypothetical protein GY856_14975, partial [bacterium]|nr:hypothetical protein [bacterium]